MKTPVVQNGKHQDKHQDETDAQPIATTAPQQHQEQQQVSDDTVPVASDNIDTLHDTNFEASTSSLFSVSSGASSMQGLNGSHPSGNTTTATAKYIYTGNPAKLSDLDRRVKHVVVSLDLTKLPPRCFAKCFNLREVDLHSSILELGDEVFSFCRSLQSIQIPSSLPHLPYQALSGCGRLKEVVLQEGLQSIGMQAFQQCSKLKTIELPSTMVRLGNAAFKGCYDLQQVIFHSSSQIQKIPAHTFCLCYSLKEIDLPSSVEELGDECFSNCVTLKSVTRPAECASKMKVIGHGCFLQCIALKELFLSREDLEQLESMGEMAFEGCAQLPSSSPYRLVTATSKMSRHSLANIRKSIKAMSIEDAVSIQEKIEKVDGIPTSSTEE